MVSQSRQKGPGGGGITPTFLAFRIGKMHLRLICGNAAFVKKLDT